MVAVAEASGAHLSVGMIERFNPKLRGRPDFQRHLVLASVGAGSSCLRRIGSDWAIHDLDLARWLARGELEVDTAQQSALLARSSPCLDGRRVTADVRSGCLTIVAWSASMAIRLISGSLEAMRLRTSCRLH